MRTVADRYPGTASKHWWLKQQNRFKLESGRTSVLMAPSSSLARLIDIIEAIELIR
jgi:hypothetical protein